MSQSRMRGLVEETIKHSYESMYRIAYSYVRNVDDALDIVQESTYRAIKNADSVKHERYMETWIYKIVINCAVDYRKKENREMLTDIPEEMIHGGTTDHYQDFDTMRALDILNEREREVILLRFFEDRELKEIARVLHINLSTTKSILYRSLKKLRAELERGMSYEAG